MKLDFEYSKMLPLSENRKKKANWLIIVDIKGIIQFGYSCMNQSGKQVEEESKENNSSVLKRSGNRASWNNTLHTPL